MTWMIAPGISIRSTTYAADGQPFVRRTRSTTASAILCPTHHSRAERFLTNYGRWPTLHQRHPHCEGRDPATTDPLLENFQFGVTNPAYNPVCLNADGGYLLLPGVTDPNQCSSINPTYMGNPNLQPGLVPYDLTRGGSMFFFHGKANINQYGFFAEDTIKTGNFTFNLGLREDQYNGLASANGVQPRLAISYLIPKSNTVLRAAYARTFETPFNENLILSSGTGAGGLAQNVFGSQSTPIEPGFRNQFNTGFQQGIKGWLVVDADYFGSTRITPTTSTSSIRRSPSPSLAQFQTRWRDGPREHHDHSRLSGLHDPRPPAPAFSHRKRRSDSTGTPLAAGVFRSITIRNISRT